MRLDGAAGLLVVVDYADRWLLTNLTWLLKNALLHQPGVLTRVLMVARTADAWPAVRGILDTYQAGTSSQVLGPWPDSPASGPACSPQRWTASPRSTSCLAVREPGRRPG